MKKYIGIVLLIAILAVIVFSSCSIFDPVPEKYIEGVEVIRYYEEDVLAIYDNAIVFDWDGYGEEIVLSLGTEDDLDDIVKFYQEYFEDNERTLYYEDEDSGEYTAKGIHEEYRYIVEVEKAEGRYIEDLYEYVIYLTVEDTQWRITPVPTLPPTPTPTLTPAPTPCIIYNASMPDGFFELDYDEATHEMMQFKSAGQCSSYMFDYIWTYSQSQMNTNAQSIESGYMDMMSVLESDSQVLYLLTDGYTLVMEDVDTNKKESVDTNLYPYSKYIKVNGTYALSTGGKGMYTYQGKEYEILFIFFINTDGNMVLSAILYDSVQQTGIHISSVNVYTPSKSFYALYDAGYGMHYLKTFDNYDDFDAAVTANAWKYVDTVAIRMEMFVNDYANIRPADEATFKFNMDGSMDYELRLIDTGELLASGSTRFGFGSNHVYLINKEIEVDGIMYQGNLYYYIDKEGYLVELYVLYNEETGMYHRVSNGNVYEKVTE